MPVVSPSASHHQPGLQPPLDTWFKGGLAFGLEYRTENYKINAGEPGSYIDADGVGNGGNAGSQGFPAFNPATRPTATATAWPPMSTWKPTRPMPSTCKTALRAEHYSDFGSTLTGKIAGSVKATPDLLFRGSP